MRIPHFRLAAEIGRSHLVLIPGFEEGLSSRERNWKKSGNTSAGEKWLLIIIFIPAENVSAAGLPPVPAPHSPQPVQ